MKIIACIDDHCGMSFNKRRQSRDRVVIDQICKFVKGYVLWISPASMGLFKERDITIKQNSTYLDLAADDDFCFVEFDLIDNVLPKVDSVYLFQWNTEYPADLLFPMSKILQEFKLMEKHDFIGYSHPIITLEVFKR